MITKGEFTSSWHDKAWRKILMLDKFVKEYEMMKYSDRKGLYKKAMIQINKTVKGELDIENVMADPDSPCRNACMLMRLDMKELMGSSERDKFKKEFGL